MRKSGTINVKIFGERNSGTNYVQQLLGRHHEIHLLKGSVERFLKPTREFIKSRILGMRKGEHLRVDRIQKDNRMTGFALRYRAVLQDLVRNAYFAVTESRNFGWKHRLVEGNKLSLSKSFEETRFICVVRNPYAWLISMRQRPYGLPIAPGSSWEAVLAFGWAPKAYEAGVKTRFESFMDAWNRKARAQLEFCETFENALLLRYEDLLEDHDEATRRIADHLETAKIGPWTPLEDPVKKGDRKDFRFYRENYRSRKWMSKIPAKLFQTINSGLDKDLCRLLNYPAVIRKEISHTEAPITL